MSEDADTIALQSARIEQLEAVNRNLQTKLDFVMTALEGVLERIDYNAGKTRCNKMLGACIGDRELISARKTLENARKPYEVQP